PWHVTSCGAASSQVVMSDPEKEVEDGTERGRMGRSGVPEPGLDRAGDDPVRDGRHAAAHRDRHAARDRAAPARGRPVDDAEGTPVNAEDVLRRCQMPPDEIRWVLNADDPAARETARSLKIARISSWPPNASMYARSVEMYTSLWCSIREIPDCWTPIASASSTCVVPRAARRSDSAKA